MDKKEKELKEALLKVKEAHEAELESGMRGVVDKIFIHGMTPKEAMNIPGAKLEKIYAEAYQLFNGGKLEKALSYFQVLALADGSDPRFLFAIGACYHRLRKYQEALGAYMVTAQFDDKAPFPLFHAVDCCLHLGDDTTAAVLLQMVLDRCGEEGAWGPMKERANLMKTRLLEKMGGNSKETKIEGGIENE